jgi:hypothetical protein
MTSRVTFEAFHPERVADAVRQPSLDLLLRRARLRRLRRRVLASTVVVAVLLTGALSLLARPRADAEPMGPHHSGTEDVIFVDPQTVVEVSFTPCYVLFSLSVDGGATWSPYRGPEPESPCHPTGSISPVGYVVVDRHTFLATVGGRQYLSTDTGVTWRGVLSPLRVDGFSPGTRLLECQGTCAGRTTVQAIAPVTGDLEELRATSGLRSFASIQGTPDGAIWVAGRDYQGAAMLAWSIDAGRTWGTKALPQDAANDMIVVARSARTAYLLLSLGDKLTSYVTTDGGLTWAWTFHAAPAAGSLVGAFSADDRSLTIASAREQWADDGQLWVSDDYGTTFTRGAPAPPGWAGSRAGMLWYHSLDDRYAYLTTDGRTWREVWLNPG